MRQSVYPIASADGKSRSKLAGENDQGSEGSVNTNYQIPSFRPKHINFSAANGPRPSLVFTESKHTTIKNNGQHVKDSFDDTAKVFPGCGNSIHVDKSERRLVFADETGGMLAEMTYSYRTHYSKQTGPGPIQSVPKDGCCVVQ